MRSVFVIDAAKKVRLTLTYPASTGRDFDEILRAIDSLQLTSSHQVATPANWRAGDDVIILASIPDEQARETVPGGLAGGAPVPPLRAGSVAGEGRAAGCAIVREVDVHAARAGRPRRGLDPHRRARAGRVGCGPHRRRAVHPARRPRRADRGGRPGPRRADRPVLPERRPLRPSGRSCSSSSATRTS